MTQLHVVPRPSFEDLLRSARRRIEAVISWEKETEDKRNRLMIAAGQALLELREAVLAGEVGELANWWEWFDDKIRICSRRQAQYYMQIASAKNPSAKANELRQKNTERNQVYRAQPKVPLARHRDARSVTMEPEKAVVRITTERRYPTAPDDDVLLGQFVDIFKRMSWDARVRALKEVNELYKRWHRGED